MYVLECTYTYWSEQKHLEWIKVSLSVNYWNKESQISLTQANNDVFTVCCPKTNFHLPSIFIKYTNCNKNERLSLPATKYGVLVINLPLLRQVLSANYFSYFYVLFFLTCIFM